MCDRDRYRTGIFINFPETVPYESLVCLKSVKHAVPDACHGAPRMADKDITVRGEYLLEKNAKTLSG